MTRVLAICAVCVQLACGESPIRPTEPPPTTPTPTPIFTREGHGNASFDVPAGLTTFRITGEYSGKRSQFIVMIGNHLVVNRPLGTDWSCTSVVATTVKCEPQREYTCVQQSTVPSTVDISGAVDDLRWIIEEVR